MLNLVALLPKLLSVTKLRIPLWVVLVVLVPALIYSFVLSRQFENARRELDQRTAEVVMLETKIHALSEQAERTRRQAQESEAACNERMADREKISRIMLAARETATVRSDSGIVKRNAPQPSFVKEGDSSPVQRNDHGDAPELISLAVSVDVVRFINAHLD